jgi:hypothetical protein
VQRRLAVTNGDDESVSDEDEDLAQLDLVLLIDVAGGI